MTKCKRKITHNLPSKAAKKTANTRYIVDSFLFLLCNQTICKTNLCSQKVISEIDKEIKLMQLQKEHRIYNRLNQIAH